MQDHVIRNVITWNRNELNRAMERRHSPQPHIAIAACRDAQRYANNISQLEEKLS